MVDLPEPESESAKSDPPPGCSLDSASEDYPIVMLSGEVDLSSAAKIYTWIWHAAGKDRRQLIINLDKVNFMDSSGLQVLLRLREKLSGRDSVVLLVKPQPQVRRLFQLTGFDKLFRLFEDNDEVRAFLDFQHDQ